VRSTGCAIGLLIFALLIAAIALWSVFSQIINGSSNNLENWIATAVGLAVMGGLLWYAFANLKKARIPASAPVPSVLTISDTELSILCTGPKRDIDLSWNRSEIADIRLSPAAPNLKLHQFKSLWAQVIFADDVVRISVMIPTGEVKDVYVLTSGRYWTDAMEVKLRNYLGLKSPLDPNRT
jgi:hypothetical protein